jgi:hypothetical protein
MNIHKIKINGVSEIDQPLNIKEDYSIVLKRCAIRSIVKKETNEDENFIYTYNLENLDVTTILSEGGTIKGTPKSASKKLRSRLYYVAEEKGLDDEKLYQDFVNYVIANIDELVDKMLDK